MKRITAILLTLMLMITACAYAENGGRPSGGFGGPGGKTGGGFGGGVDKSSDETLQSLISTYTEAFTQETYTDAETGLSIIYNAFLPDGYSADQLYPTIVFIADSSCANGNAETSLTQGYGAYVWVTEEFQSTHPCIVLVPTYPSTILDDHGSYTTTEYVELTKRFVEYAKETYAIDPARIYGTGQSMGCMTTMVLESEYNDLYTACMFVDGQWDSGVTSALADNTFVYFAAEGDASAYAGMQEMIPIWEANGATIAQAQWDATWSEEEIAAAASELFSQEANIYCITWKEGTVLPEGTAAGTSEHMYSFDYAYKATPVLEWLITQ